MDKVIIDGVEVSGCSCYENGKCLWTKRYYENNIVPDCEKVKNCYYKQLQRAKAENEQLKADIESRTMCITCERELQNCNLQAENERLKKELEKRQTILWTNKQGKHINIKDMNNTYLINTIALLERQAELDEIQADYRSY